MSRKRRKRRKKALSLPAGIRKGPTFCGFPLNTKKVNQLWNWETLEDIKF